MCIKLNELQFKKADKDIPCYKVLIEINCGCYYTPFTLERVYPETGRISTDKNKSFEITEGLSDGYLVSDGFIHTYISKEKAEGICESIINWYADADIVSHVFRCVIPEGTVYCDDDESYASRSVKYICYESSKGGFDAAEDDSTRMVRFIRVAARLHKWYSVPALVKIYNRMHDGDFHMPNQLFPDDYFGLCKQPNPNGVLLNLAKFIDCAILTGDDTNRMDHMNKNNHKLMLCYILSHSLLSVNNNGITTDRFADAVLDTDIVRSLQWNDLDGMDEIDASGMVMFNTPYEYFMHMFGNGHYNLSYNEKAVVYRMSNVIADRIMTEEI